MGHKHSKEKLDGEDIKRQAELQVLLAVQVFKSDKWGKTPVDKKLSDIHKTLQELYDKVNEAGKTKAIPYAKTAELAVLDAQLRFITHGGPPAPGTGTEAALFALAPLENWVYNNTSHGEKLGLQRHPRAPSSEELARNDEEIAEEQARNQAERS
mmetsp:Transcript_17119/g.56183  ORF Transcript_17119/g.56183 Transcript_17119/m.56183 type:complete len:155 (-) Transcript_17119:1337-1801(-)